jgi:methylenetetrahydrofolate dehydrogenase (NADP+)/methenyltetrahydrofolate cyclohydrolase
MQILDWKKLSEKIKNNLKTQIENEKIFAHIWVILIWDNPASKIYVKFKEKFANEIWVKFTKFLYWNEISEKEILEKIEELNNDKNFTGIFVQLPIPDHISVKKIIEKISSTKDIDWFCPENIWEMFLWNTEEKDLILPATPKWIIRILDEYKIDVQWKNTVVFWRSNIVWKPISTILLNKWATVTTCHSKTKDLDFYTKNADLIVSAVWIENFLKWENIKDWVVIIDVWINQNLDQKNNKCQIVWDSNFESCAKKSSFITPVPGWVWPMTIASLMENAVKLGKKIKRKKLVFPAQWDIWTCDFKKNIWFEQNWIRPCLIINKKNTKEKTCIAIPCSNTKRENSVEIKWFNLLIHQSRVINLSRLWRKITRLNKEDTNIILSNLCNFLKIKNG